ncbi:hypothetical protein PIB30_066413 [Stylosanthes scabra]|uniref:Uncharacterized protein n=1 Tax=Stylosanthes scabra TaxID=79078 RepID=A0ABU6RML9_9FABA|nr:hypothetical protein [Stylosanthes scabra]
MITHLRGTTLLLGICEAGCDGRLVRGRGGCSDEAAMDGERRRRGWVDLLVATLRLRGSAGHEGKAGMICGCKSRTNDEKQGCVGQQQAPALLSWMAFPMNGVRGVLRWSTEEGIKLANGKLSSVVRRLLGSGRVPGLTSNPNPILPAVKPAPLSTLPVADRVGNPTCKIRKNIR